MESLTTGQHPDRKRKRACSSASLPTPPSLASDVSLPPPATTEDLEITDSAAILEGDANDTDEDEALLNTSLHVLRTESLALASIATLYTTSSTAQASLQAVTHAVLSAQRSARRLVVCAVGKSAFIAQKFVATCKSLSLAASFLHACEAVHGDLGDVRSGDVVLFVSFSGRTPELLNLLLHLPGEVRVVALTGQTRPQDCRLLDGLQDGILLPAPIPETEEASFGVSAPTTSTTVALAVSDMLALTLAEGVHGRGGGKREVFRRNHPGGAIGMAGAKRARREREREKGVLGDVEVKPVDLPPSPEISGSDDR